MTAAIAPLAPSMGIVEPGETTTWARSHHTTAKVEEQAFRPAHSTTPNFRFLLMVSSPRVAFLP